MNISVKVMDCYSGERTFCLLRFVPMIAPVASGKGLRGKMPFEQTINGLSTKKSPTNKQTKKINGAVRMAQ